MQVSEHAYAVILAGGGGTRLWPKSRQKTPKHLLKLFGKDTILQLTYQRIRLIFEPQKIFIITHKNHLEEAKIQLPEMLEDRWIVESEAKNTALAIAMAAAHVAKEDPEAVILNVHSDQVIKSEDKFCQAAAEAIRVAAETDNIVTIAIKPTFAHTGLGYIRIGNQLEGTKAFKALGFKEKPDLSTAQAFLASGQYLWNSGMYSWSVKNLFASFAQHAPELKQAIDQAMEVIGTDQEQQVINKIYEQAENLAIDVAVSEKATNLVVVPGDFDWSDVGDWKVMYDTGQKDNSGNVVSNPANFIQIDTKDSLIENNGRLVVTIGLKDVIVVDTDDALLVCHKDRSQDVKKIVEQLKEDKKDQLL